MSGDKNQNSNPEKRLENKKGEAHEPVKDKPILDKDDNALQQRAELLASLKVHRFTKPGQQPFVIDMGENQITDRRPILQQASADKTLPSDREHRTEATEATEAHKEPLRVREQFGLVTQGAEANRDHALKVEGAIEQLPPNVQHFLETHKIKIVAARAIIDELPGLKNDHPRDWPNGKTWNNVEGTFRTDRNEVVVSEFVLGADQQWHPNSRVDGVARHETGHAIDHALGDFSIKDPNFIAAYNKEAANLPPDVKKQLNYILQPGYAGRQEAFGELFATLNGGASLDVTGSQTYSNILRKYFPETLKVIQHKMESI